LSVEKLVQSSLYTLYALFAPIKWYLKFKANIQREDSFGRIDINRLMNMRGGEEERRRKSGVSTLVM
jgi:hypothetical protein